MIGLLVMGVVVMFGTNAHAQSFDGWGWFGFSGITGEICTSHTPNPQSKPSEMRVSVTATIQIACLNPANNGVFNGVAFHKPLTDSAVPGSQGFIDTKGNAVTEVFLYLSQFEDRANCPNKNWTPISDSAMALDFSGEVDWCLLDKDGNLINDCKGKGLLATSSVTCTLDTTLYPRNRNGTAPHPARFSCSPLDSPTCKGQFQ
jgi:hypothetical protein